MSDGDLDPDTVPITQDTALKHPRVEAGAVSWLSSNLIDTSNPQKQQRMPRDKGHDQDSHGDTA
ncbi:hypothetical protein VNI00_018966 [Paramarasmius palmivorus]|uniref:Uncharacterized protein n=1 Tax=Paramarasmius palmivorus TaxID=297713 RepID=A0AAW0ATR3_9AGAR